MPFQLAKINQAWIIPIILLVLVAYHFSLGTYYSVEDAKAPFYLREGSLNGMLSLIHYGLGVLLLGYALITILAKNAASKILPLVFSLLSLLIYERWYSEKFKLFEPKGTPQYYEQVREFGVFRGATSLDYYAFILTSLLFLYVFYNLGNNALKNNKKIN